MNFSQDQAPPDPKLSFSEIPADTFLTLSPGSGPDRERFESGFSSRALRSQAHLPVHGIHPDRRT